jgi:Tfp pilus assembly protein PilE
MKNMELLNTKIPYSVKKLIAVNSISYCYTELPIDRHCALFGRNNLGKTSLLNALKLHFFPEISFNGCEAKFAFKSSKGELYSSEDSYSYYFPSDSSFLILEAENIHGPFCLILFKSNSSFGYQRLALPCAYEEIRAQFWDIHNTKVNNGLGSPVTNLGIPKIHTLYQQYKAAGAVLLTTKKDLKDKLFSHNPMQRAKGRYCLVPLKEGGMERELSAFRQLMNFTFEIAKTDTKGLTETFATIIESGKINSQDKLHQDLQTILDEYNALRQNQDQLKAIANYRDDFTQLSGLSQTLQDHQLGFIGTFKAYDAYLNSRSVDIQRQLTKLEPEVRKLASEQNRLKETENKQRELSGNFNGQLKTLNTDMKQLNQKIERFHKIQNEYPNSSISDIRLALNTYQNELEEDIVHFNDRQTAIDKLSNTVLLQKSKIADRDKKKQAIEHQEKLLISQLDEHSATVLSNLNEQFSSFMVTPNSGQTQVIEQFGQLFTVEESGMNFLGSSFNKEKLKSPQQFREQLQRDLDDLNADIQRLNVEAQQLQKKATASGEFQKAQLQEAQKNLEIAKHDLIVVNAIEDIQQQWQIKTVAIETIVNEQRLLEKQRQETQGLLEQNRTDYVAAKESQDIFFKQTQDSTLLLQRLQNLKPEELDSIEFQAVLGVSVSDLVELEAEQAKLKVLKESLNSKINSFVQCGHFLVPVEMARSSYSHEQQSAIIKALANTFAALPDQFENLQSRIIEHNKMTGAKISELTGNRSHIRSFINKVNKQFENYTISNLKDIRVEIELDHRFEELVNELDRTNLNTTDIHEDGLYQRLNQFCEDFFMGSRGNRILEMSKIITNVKYSYKKEHQDKREEKDQSTGTNALINCTLLTILLRDLLAQDSELTLPVIFDEFTALDEYNQRTAIQAATKHGFALFCASPTQTAEVVAVVDIYISLDDFHANTIYDPTGERDLVFHHFWERLYDVTEPTAL